jgi:5-methylcytosine-specific restriction protein A
MKKLCPNGHKYTQARCPECRKPKSTRGSSEYGWRWDELSRRYRAIHPLCQDCEKRGRITPCTEVHHVVPILEDESRKFDWDNLVALCHSCHVARHRQ